MDWVFWVEVVGAIVAIVVLTGIRYIRNDRIGIVEKRWSALLEGNPYVDRTIFLDRGSMRGILGSWRDLRASLPGFLSSSVHMRLEAGVSQLEVGTIVLKKMGGVEGSTVSVTTMSVPKDAHEAFEKGRKAGTEKKYDEAVRELNKAVGIYPQYAAAWSMLGEIHRLQNQFEPAKSEYARALAADPKFVSPYFGLAAMAVIENKWAEAEQLTDQLIQLNSFAYPLAYFFNAAANFNLGKLDAAEQSARKFQQMDKAHTRPDIALLLAGILTSKHQYAEAAQLYRDFLALNPDTPNAEKLRAEAQRLEGLSAAKQ